MASAPVYAATATIDMVQAVTANTARDGTGTLATVATGTANGKIIKRVRISATGTTTAGVIRLFLFDGTNNRLLREIMVTAITPSATIEAFSAEVTLYDCILPSTLWLLKASTNNAETFNVFAFGGVI